MKKFEVLNKGNKRFVLTVTPWRVTIKLQEGSSEGLCARVVNFLTWVSNQPEMLNTEISFRGRTDVPLTDTGLMIQMRNDNDKIKYTYYESDINLKRPHDSKNVMSQVA